MARQNHSWKRIGQRLSPTTARAWRRRLWIWGLPLWGLSGLAVFGWGALRFVQTYPTQETQAPDWELNTNGFLTPKLIENFIHPERSKPLIKTPIFELKAQLEKIPQVKTAHVTRCFPQKLHLDITEHTPAFRLASPPQRKGAQRFVSSTGHIFTARGLKRRHVNTLPTLTEVCEDTPHIAGIETLLALRDALKHHASALPLRDLQISCRHFYPQTQDPRSVLYLQSPSLAQITLAPQDFKNQLKHLDQVLHYAQERRLALSHIDLSLSPDQATAF